MYASYSKFMYQSVNMHAIIVNFMLTKTCTSYKQLCTFSYHCYTVPLIKHCMTLCFTDSIPMFSRAFISWLQVASGCNSSHFTSILLQQAPASLGWSTFITSNTPTVSSVSSCVPRSCHRAANPLVSGFKIFLSCFEVG